MTDATLAQGNQILDLIRREDSSRTFAQNLISNWGAVQTIGRGEVDQAAFMEAVKGIVNPYASEQVETRFFYPEGWSPTSVEEQLAVLQWFYPELDGKHVLQLVEGMSVPDGADGLFVIPKLSNIAAKLGIDEPYGKGYGKMLETTVLVHLANQRKFHNYRTGEMGADRLHIRQSAAEAIRSLEAETQGDFLILPAQTGMKWGGYSPRNARWEMEHGTTEFPLEAWVVGHILLTNPERLGRYQDLVIDCPGVDYRLRHGDGPDDCLYFSFDYGKLYLGNGWVGGADDVTGSASGFLR